eukprot:1733099-Rhodomonas_salina.2
MRCTGLTRAGTRAGGGGEACGRERAAGECGASTGGAGAARGAQGAHVVGERVRLPPRRPHDDQRE